MRFTHTRKLLDAPSNNWCAPNSALWLQDPDAQLIIDLMRSERDKLGFVPIPYLLKQIRSKDCVIWQRDDSGRRIGYIIHTPIKPGREIRIWLSVIDVDRRRRKFATRALADLISKAYKSDAPLIRLRCAADLPANHFWLASGFNHIATIKPPTRNPRDLNLYTITRDQFRQIRLPVLVKNPRQLFTDSPPE